MIELRRRPRPGPAIFLPALLALGPAACRDPAASSPVITLPPASASADTGAPAPLPAPSAPAPSALPYGASEAQPDDEQNDNGGCKRRRNSGTVVACEKATANFGSWSPTPGELVEAMRHAGGVCYCADGLHVPAETCAKRVGATTVSITLGKDDEPTDCRLSASAVSWKTRRWIVVSAFNRDQATFYSVISIQERTAKGFATYFEGYNNLPSDSEIQQGAQGVSPAMKREWPTLPGDVKKALGAS